LSATGGTDLVTVAGTPPDRVIKFSVYGEPRSKQRPRVTRYGTYTPKETLEAEAKILAAWINLNEGLFTHQVVLDINFFNATKRRRDVDNMGKLVLDALNGHAFFDDFHVVGLNLKKTFTSKSKARTEIRISEVISWPYES
jgi:Holliday junction resolvase RusA-like endonuclease